MYNMLLIQVNPKTGEEHLFPLPKEYKEAEANEILEKCLELCEADDETNSVRTALKELKKKAV